MSVPVLACARFSRLPRPRSPSPPAQGRLAAALEAAQRLAEQTREGAAAAVALAEAAEKAADDAAQEAKQVAHVGVGEAPTDAAGLAAVSVRAVIDDVAYHRDHMAEEGSAHEVSHDAADGIGNGFHVA